MLKDSQAFGSFSTDDIAAAATFYGDTLGLDIETMPDTTMGGMLFIKHPDGGRTFVYAKDDHVPATHTVLNFRSEDFAGTIADLRSKGIALEQLEWTDADGIATDPDSDMGSMAWFRDPAGNWIAVLEDTDVD